MHCDCQSQDQILGLHNLKLSEDNDVYFGQTPLNENIKEDQLQCFEDECILNTQISKQIKLKRGNELIIRAEHKELKKQLNLV